MNNKTIGNAIRSERKKHNITQKELAEHLGVSASMIAQYETGKRKPKLETVRRLAEALNVPMGDLIVNWNDYATSEIVNDIADNDYTAHLKRQARLIAKYYEELNALGQSKAIEQVEMLTKIPEYQKEKPEDESYLRPNAAHVRTDIEVTEEMRQHDEELMNDDE